MFLKIFVQLPNTISQCRSILERDSFEVNSKPIGECTTFETNLNFTLRQRIDRFNAPTIKNRFMIDCGISGGTWIEIPAERYRLNLAEPKTTSQIEINIHHSDIINHPPEGTSIPIGV